MNIAYFCVFIAGIMPIMWAAYAKYSLGFSMKDNANPRDFLAKATGKSQRAKWAQENAWESFAPFAAAVIIASISGVAVPIVNYVAVTFIILRFLYGIFYILDLASLRSLVWFGGMACNAILYWCALVR